MAELRITEPIRSGIEDLTTIPGVQLEPLHHSLEAPEAQPVLQPEELESSNKDRERSLLTYLNQLKDSNVIAPETNSGAQTLWLMLSAKCELLAVPDAGPGPDGQVFFMWRTDHEYFEAELCEDGEVSFFYQDRAGGEIGGWDSTIDEPIPDEVIAKLESFH